MGATPDLGHPVLAGQFATIARRPIQILALVLLVLLVVVHNAAAADRVGRAASAYARYDFQPAYITGTVGTGRNMRNLPCQSRKTNETGRCMFVFDCQKSNGTHLGVCVDRVFFGSCCKLPDNETILDRTAILPTRAPPSRINTTISNATTTPSTPPLTSTTVQSTQKLSTFQSVESSTLSSTATTTPTTTITTTTPTSTTTRKSTTTKAKPKPKPKPKPSKKPTKPTTPSSTRTTPTSTTKTTTTPATPITTTSATSTTTKVPPTLRIPVTTPYNEILPFKENHTVVSGNIMTNKIEVKDTVNLTTQPPPMFVTWTSVTESVKSTIVPVSESTNQSTVDEWVLLPSVPPNSTVSPTFVKNDTTDSNSISDRLTTVVVLPETTTTVNLPIDLTSTTTFSTITTIIAGTVPTDLASSSLRPSSSSSSSPSSSPPPPTTLQSAVTMTPLLSSSSATSTASAINMSDYTAVCGRRMYPEARIVGGEKASFGKWPWQISLRQWKTSTYLHKCGAALLNENWAITAAHCVDNVPPSDLLVRLGEHDLTSELEPYLHQERRVQLVASHPQFDSRTYEYDLALLRFYEPVKFQPNILPVCLPDNDDNFIGKTAHVTGWGRLYADGPLPSVLQEVSVPVINNTVCENMYRHAGYPEYIPEIFICAGWTKGGFDSCEGDSGGPMVIKRDDGRFILSGVISWGIGCAEPNQPGVYTRISKFTDWIRQILQF